MTETACAPQTVPDLFTADAGCWLLLAHLPGLGRKRRLALLEQLETPQQLAAANSATLKSLGLGGVAIGTVLAWQRQDRKHPELVRLQHYLSRCQCQGIELMTWADHDYPEPLRHIHDAPLVLYLKGDRALLGRDQIGVVGSRNASPAGLDHARRFAVALSERGYLVTSGLALGVDGAAHAGALDAGFPTVAVIGTGVDVSYPRSHRKLAERIAEHGVIVSDLPPGSPPKAAHFPQRNRIISGLSRGILVVEAGLRSGSLITARLALEQGREVFAIPGSVHNPQARGCHQLIRQGASLVESVADIEQELGAWWTVPGTDRARAETAAAGQAPQLALDSGAPTGLDEREIAVWQALGYDPQSTDELCDGTALAADQLMQALLLLEMQGLVASVPGGYIRLA
ncbi:DNA-processing protein DprA [Marinobacter sp. SS21]|uniref:DNA-processing protein DprA n=1 Tax=Marinobacter sp. SS21 TaxID=2979460 RepID=UPI00232C6BB7|nr:DNA-processing protein DprA [Marinobacter sp. SS21]MDC0660978.1 DNA-processing protein DprA [Marinobacter sp. SS21]